MKISFKNDILISFTPFLSIFPLLSVELIVSPDKNNDFIVFFFWFSAMVARVQTAEEIRDEGNAAVKDQDYIKADELLVFLKFQWKTEIKLISRYTEALQLTTDEDKALRPVLYRNRAMARLKRDDFEGAQSDCTKGLQKTWKIC